MYVVICGGGKVGWNLARELIEKNAEVKAVAEPPTEAESVG